MSVDEKSFKNILIRLEKLEATVFGDKKTPSHKPETAAIDKHDGPTGGVRLLIKQGFFSAKRSIDEVHSELQTNDYQYIKDVVRNSLNRLSSSSGPLVAIKTADGKLYVKRK